VALTADRATILVEWRRRVRAGWGLGPHWHTIDGTAPLVTTLLDGTADPCDVLSELGRRCGHDGHPLDQVTAWTGELIDVLPRRLRRKVDQRRAAVALATGWAEGALERRHSRSFGVAPMGALRLALEQCYDRCESIGTNASDSYSLVVLDADSGLLPPVPRAAAMAAIASHARRAFAAGEPMAATPTGRLLVLAERSPDLPSVVRSIVATCEVSPLLAGCSRVQGWLEPLPPDRTHIDGYLAELAP
jgi:hypothetical protein